MFMHLLDKHYICVGLNFVIGSISKFDIKASFIILDHFDGKKEHIIASALSSRLEDWKFFRGLEKRMFRQQILSNGSRYVRDGKLHLCVVLERMSLHEISNEPLQSMDEIKVNETFTAITSKAEMITLRTADGDELNAIKSCLSEGSIVFQRMFENDMAETINGIVEVIDFSGEAMKELLRFLYTGKAEMEEIEIELYNVAKAYQVEGLQNICVKSIKSRVSNRNVFEILQFAEMNDEVDLYNFCLEIISL